MRYVVMQAVAELEKLGYDPEVVDLISLKPFDMKVSSEILEFFFLKREGEGKKKSGEKKMR